MSATKDDLVFELQCCSQNYQWGKQGSDSEVAQLLKSGNSSFQINEDTPYAELWMGTHPNAPSMISGQDNVSLGDWVNKHPEKIGSAVNEKFNGALPFLFKVLSVKKALSIQAHPNKKHAEELHQRDPKNYKDPNHKPEMAIALTDFTGLCGFRPIKEMADFVQRLEELRNVIGSDNADKLIAASTSTTVADHETAIRDSFSTMMRQDKTFVAQELQKLVQKVKDLDRSGQDTSAYVGDILLKLDAEFPGDVGGFSVYFLNVMRLKKGEAIFLEANLPHAYLSGDCMECMACSDNVVRAGLTPKFIDTETLIGMLNYTGKPADDNKFLPTSCTENGCNVRKFIPPIADFAVTEIMVDSGKTSADIPAVDSASILICIQGSASLSNQSLSQDIQMQRGTILFIAANEKVSLKIEPANGLLVYRAHAGC